MVVAQLVERSLPVPEVCGSNLVIGKIYIEHLLSTVLTRRKIKKKRPGIAHFLKKTNLNRSFDRLFRSDALEVRRERPQRINGSQGPADQRMRIRQRMLEQQQQEWTQLAVGNLEKQETEMGKSYIWLGNVLGICIEDIVYT